MTEGNRIESLLVQEEGKTRELIIITDRCTEVNSEAARKTTASEFFSEVSRLLNEARMMTLGLFVNRGWENSMNFV